MCVLLYVKCVLSEAHKTIKKSGVFFPCFGQKQSPSLAATNSVHNYSSSDTTAAVLHALAFVPVVTVCVAGAQQQEIEP